MEDEEAEEEAEEEEEDKDPSLFIIPGSVVFIICIAKSIRPKWMALRNM